MTDIRVMQYYVTDTRENDYTGQSDGFLLGGVIIFDLKSAYIVINMQLREVTLPTLIKDSNRQHASR